MSGVRGKLSGGGVELKGKLVEVEEEISNLSTLPWTQTNINSILMKYNISDNHLIMRYKFNINNKNIFKALLLF